MANLNDRRTGWLRCLRVGDRVKISSPNTVDTVHSIVKITPAGKIDLAVGNDTIRFHWNGYSCGAWFKLEPLG